MTSGAVSAAGLAAGGLLGGCDTGRESSPDAGSTAPPNIVLIITDQQHHDTVAANGCRYVRTPGLDNLARNGVSFTRTYCPYPLCTPSRGGMLTGRTPSESGVYQNELSIREDFPTLGAWLRDRAGYETVYAGKWHLPETYTTTIPGFTVLNTGLIGQGNFCDTSVSTACEAYIRNRTGSGPFFMAASFMQPHDICEWLRLNLRNQAVLRYPEIEGDLPELPRNFGIPEHEPAAVRNMRMRNEPHRGEWSERHWRYYLWSYYRHIEMVDAEIGRIVSALDETGQRGDTLVVFIADHGEGCGHHTMVRKSSFYDESVKVPMIMSCPRSIPAGKEETCLSSGLDLFPTFCDYAGVETPKVMRGVSLRPVLESGKTPSRGFIASEAASNNAQMIRSERYKYIAYKNDPVEQLFDMEKDPGETVNLLGDPSSGSVLDEHRNILRGWVADLDVAPGVPEENRWPVG